MAIRAWPARFLFAPAAGHPPRPAREAGIYTGSFGAKPSAPSSPTSAFTALGRRLVPKLWDETIDAHRRAVREATLETTAALVAEHGLRAVTMSQIAQETGIGRATLYKYFPDVETILAAWHARQVDRHVHELAALDDKSSGAVQRLEVLLEAYALIQLEHHGAELASLLHRGEHVARARRHLHDFIADILTEGAASGELRKDIAPDELATYCLHALGAASSFRSKAAVRRLVAVTLAGLRSQGRIASQRE